MEGVVLLSEINPRGWVVHPLAQANEWFGLLNDNDIAKLQSEPNLEFEKCIELIYERCIESGNQLVIRDWNHLDFVALPYLSTQTNRLSLIDSLQNTYDTNSDVKPFSFSITSLTHLSIGSGKSFILKYPQSVCS